jgi:hypothetical protein
MSDEINDSEREQRDDATPQPTPAPTPPPAPAAPPPAAPAVSDAEVARPRAKRWAKTAVVSVVLGAALLFALWAAITLNYVYESGERAGFVRTLSKEGWICKTWEGELATAQPLDTVPQLFSFTVRSDSIARVIQRTIGDRVALHYERHLGLPGRCFGETEYFVTGVRVLQE